jgi:GNAT superfamily N-acetyltransferase
VGVFQTWYRRSIFANLGPKEGWTKSLFATISNGISDFKKSDEKACWSLKYPDPPSKDFLTKSPEQRVIRRPKKKRDSEPTLASTAGVKKRTRTSSQPKKPYDIPQKTPVDTNLIWTSLANASSITSLSSLQSDYLQSSSLLDPHFNANEHLVDPNYLPSLEFLNSITPAIPLNSGITSEGHLSLGPVPIHSEEQTDMVLIRPLHSMMKEVKKEPETNNFPLSFEQLVAERFSTTNSVDSVKIGVKKYDAVEMGRRNKKKRKDHRLTAEEEQNLLRRLEESVMLSIPAARLRRKLVVRFANRQQGQKLFNIDQWMKSYYRPSGPKLTPLTVSFEIQTQVVFPDGKVSQLRIPGKTSYEVLQKLEKAATIRELEYSNSFIPKVYGSFMFEKTLTSPKSFYSTFSGKLLSKYIHRDFHCRPQRMRLLHQIRKDCALRDSVDYVYFQESHLDMVNKLLELVFWEGIDVSEELLTPDFTIVALYKRFVVGACFMTPEGYISYIAVAPGWEKAGIGKFMLFHMIKKAKANLCDITLHVSANNPSMVTNFNSRSCTNLLDSSLSRSS